MLHLLSRIGSTEQRLCSDGTSRSAHPQSGKDAARLTTYRLINKYTGSPRTMPVIWRYEPVNVMSRPPNERYAVLRSTVIREQ